MSNRPSMSHPAQPSGTPPLLDSVGSDMVGVIRGRPDLLLGRGTIVEPRTIFLLFALFSILFMTINLGSAPIQLWDESRLAVNAMEMYLTGLSPITTYDFLPDHWNT